MNFLNNINNFFKYFFENVETSFGKLLNFFLIWRCIAIILVLLDCFLKDKEGYDLFYRKCRVQ